MQRRAVRISRTCRGVAGVLAVVGALIVAASASAGEHSVALPPVTMQVDGTNGAFQPSGVVLAPGFPVSVTATGLANFGAGDGCSDSDCGTNPDGVSPSGNTFGLADGSFLGPGLPAFTLIAKIGDAAPFVVGSGPTLISGVGPVTFAYNDNFFGDNSGGYTVTLTATLNQSQCKGDGWKTLGLFKNQGDCVSYVATGGKNSPAG
ncbi:MAG TPA: hypothetical protein VHU90_04535 [Galbitalea sp.]|nr:hypothetical protein [Galbitalea sp.]